MTFIETVPDAQATGALEEVYEVDREAFADLPNFTKAFSLRPEVYAAWRHLNGAIKANMDLRRYEPSFSSRRRCEPWCTISGQPTSSLPISP